jgi:hypothetical protein
VLSYLTAESSFLRAYGNRSLLLLLMCVLVRTGNAGGQADGSIAKISALGLSADINPAVVLWFGPVVALLMVISLKMEADTLRVAREVVLEEAGGLKMRITVSWWTYVLFYTPTVVAAYMTLQFVLKLFPGSDCANWSWLRQFYDFGGWGEPSIYCFGDLKKGTPYVYPPIQTWFYIGCVITCAYLTYRMGREWKRSRGGVAPAD